MGVKLVNIDEVITLTLLQFRELIGPEVVVRATRESIEDIQRAFIDAFTRTQVYRSLLDQATNGPGDIFADMGLNPLEGISILVDIVTIIERSVKIANIDLRAAGGRFASASNTEVISWRIEIEDIEGNLRAGGFDYESQGGAVPWMTWLLDGGGIAGYEIVYDYTGKLTTSRSGRAYMRRNQGFFWNVDSDQYAERDNFVTDILEDQIWPGEVEDILTNKIGQLLRTERWTIE